MAARTNGWWGRAVIALALLAIVLFYAAGAAVFWAEADAVALAQALPPAANLIVAVADFCWALPGAVRAL
ncbi:hypothetical protein [Phenylobacterium sp.]|uniref:hypothetical protein n=1 Tax=Phenylobacterium sp. TaxID=1871053 RepID=UPI0027336088|nr:hypothetical protein [Phenylobacterium sp.]MDP3853122.1 hypothetical protein [Phenylobacterium sp.]